MRVYFTAKAFTNEWMSALKKGSNCRLLARLSPNTLNFQVAYASGCLFPFFVILWCFCFSWKGNGGQRNKKARCTFPRWENPFRKKGRGSEDNIEKQMFSAESGLNIFIDFRFQFPLLSFFIHRFERVIKNRAQGWSHLLCKVKVRNCQSALLQLNYLGGT